MPIELLSGDMVSFKPEWSILRQFTMVKDKLEDLGIKSEENETFPVDVISVVLQMVIEWATQHKDDPEPSEERPAPEPNAKPKMTKWDKDFMTKLRNDPGTLFEVLLAAKHLEAKGLLEMTCHTLQEMIKGKSPEQLRTLFKIQNDFSKEEEAQIKMENEWCQESK